MTQERNAGKSKVERQPTNWGRILLVALVSLVIAFIIFRFVISPIFLAPAIDGVFDNITATLEPGS